MSYDLYVFHSNEPQTDESVAALVDAFSGLGGTPGPNIAAFLDEFLAQAREIGDLPPGEPWRGEIDASGDSLRIGMPMGTPDDIAGLILTLVEKHGLFAFDPQDGTLISGPGELFHDNTPDDVPGVGTVALVFGLPLILLVAGGYWLFF